MSPKKNSRSESRAPRRSRDRANPGALISRAHRADTTTVRPPQTTRPPGARFPAVAGGMRTVLGVAYVVAFLCAASLPFVAFGPTGLLVLAPTGLWLAPGLRTRVRRAGTLTDGVVGWPGLTALVSAAFSAAFMAVGGLATVAAWLASVAACGVLEMARARVARDDNLRAESRPHVARPW